MATVLEDVSRTYEAIVESLHALVTFQSKITPNGALSDQFEELSEVIDFQKDRLRAHASAFTIQAQLPLTSLLREINSVSRWFSDNDANLKGFWPPQQISDAVEGVREKSLHVYVGRVSMAILLSQDSNPALEDLALTSFGEAADDLDLEPFVDMTKIAQPSALLASVRRLKQDYAEFDDGVADFATSRGGKALHSITVIMETAAGQANNVDDRARSLAQLVVQDFEINDTSATSLRPASPSTIDSPLDPHHSEYDGPFRSGTHSSRARAMGNNTPSPASTPTEDAYTFRPSFVPDSAFQLEHELFDSNIPSHGTSTSAAPEASLTVPSSSSAAMEPPPRGETPVSNSGRSGRTTASSGEASLGEQLRLTSSIIAFNARDALTNEPLVDPVLGSDGLIHDRWSLIDSQDELAQSIQILGDVVQLREAIHSAQEGKKLEFAQKRAAYRNNAIDLCTSSDQKQMLECIDRLSKVLQWKADDVDILTRRGVLHYRLRMLSEAKEDLDNAVKLSRISSLVNLPNLDSLRYRCLVLSEIRDVQNALTDIDEIWRQSKDDALTLSLRATIRAGKGDFENAARDLDDVQKTLETGGGSQSRLADENRDLDLLAKGWAHSSIGQIEAAMNDFEMAQSLRIFDAYNVSCLGISLVHYGLTISAGGEETAGQDKIRQGLAELTSAVMVVSRSSAGDELALPSPNGAVDDELRGLTMTSHAYDPFFLRGMANFALGKFEEALEDFDVAQRVRPKIVKDTGEFHCVLAILQAETRQFEKATRSFDYAMALKPEERENYFAKRSQYGL